MKSHWIFSKDYYNNDAANQAIGISIQPKQQQILYVYFIYSQASESGKEYNLYYRWSETNCKILESWTSADGEFYFPCDDYIGNFGKFKTNVLILFYPDILRLSYGATANGETLFVFIRAASNIYAKPTVSLLNAYTKEGSSLTAENKIIGVI